MLESFFRGVALVRDRRSLIGFFEIGTYLYIGLTFLSLVIIYHSFIKLSIVKMYEMH